MIGLVRQRGASLIAAVFLITAMAALGALMTNLTVHSSIVTVNEYFSSRALLAAESGFDWAIYDIINNSGGTRGETGGAVAMESGEDIWFNTTVTTWIIDSDNPNQATYYEITSQGMAGGTSANPKVVRTLRLQFMAN
jgi:hypothetical protein